MVSARLDKETYNDLRTMVKSEGKSLAGFLKDFVRKKYEKWAGAYRMGYETGKEAHQIWYRCNVCDEKIFIQPNSESHRDMIKYMKEHKWGHKRCHEE